MPPTIDGQDSVTTAKIDRAPQESGALKSDERSVPTDAAATGSSSAPEPAPLMSVPEYARHRRIDRNKVAKAIDCRRLDASVVRINGRNFINAALADEEWSANTRPKMPSVLREANTDQIGTEGTGGGSASAAIGKTADGKPAPYLAARASREEAEARRAHAAAETAEINLAVRRKETIEIAKAQRDLDAAVTASKTHLRGIPTRIAQSMPHIAARDIAAIGKLIDHALEELSAVEL